MANISQKLEKYLKKFFGFESFKCPEQSEAIAAVLTKSCDILINLPPAAGKSMCFQLPTVLIHGGRKSIIIVPNNNMVEDQVKYLLNHGIDAAYFNFKVSKQNRRLIAEKIINHELEVKFIFVTIGLFFSHDFQDLIKALSNQNSISMFVVDEAHCVSQSSIDYMEAYTKIHKVREICPNIKFIALTSVGTEKINSNIRENLQLKNTHEIGHCQWRRPNIYIQVKFRDILENPFEDMKELIANFMNAIENFCGIVFCRRVEETTMVAQQLTLLDIPTVAYNSKMKNEDRSKNKSDWMSGKVKMIAVTHHFGIGLDKSSVMCIIHWSLPFTIEQYYRDIGRAGRHNERALCRMYLGVEDWMNAQAIALGMSPHLFKDFENVIQYCISDECRHVFYSRYFGINVAPCQVACDACDRNVFFDKALEKFKVFNQQRKLLTKIVHLPSTEVYNDKKTDKFIKDLKLETRLNYYRRLANALVKNYQEANCINKPDIEMKYLHCLARKIEYLKFCTNYEKCKYSYEMFHLIDHIDKDSRKLKLSNYIINYKFQRL